MEKNRERISLKHFLLVVWHSICSHKDEKVYLMIIYMIIIDKT